MPRPDTVEIEAGDTYVPDTRIINAEDFDPDVHTRVGEPVEEESAEAEPAGEDPQTNEDPEVDWEITDNGWWTITYGGKEITGRGEEELNETLEEMGVVR